MRDFCVQLLNILSVLCGLLCPREGERGSAWGSTRVRRVRGTSLVPLTLLRVWSFNIYATAPERGGTPPAFLSPKNSTNYERMQK